MSDLDSKRSLTAREVRATRIVRAKTFMNSTKSTGSNGKQNLTVRLDRQTIHKAKVIAARRSTSISGLLAQQIEILVGEEEAYSRAERQAAELLDHGFSLGGTIQATRDELHER